MKKWMRSRLLLAVLTLTPAPASAQHVLVAYHSQTGHTERMARAVTDGVESVDGAAARMRRVGDVAAEDLAWADAVVVGTPVHNANVSAPVVEFINSWPFDGTMRDKLGAAFVTGGGMSAGEETAQLAILRSMLVFGMVVAGGPEWTSPFGASAVTDEAPFEDSADHAQVDEIFLAKGRALGQRVAALARRPGSG